MATLNLLNTNVVIKPEKKKIPIGMLSYFAKKDRDFDEWILCDGRMLSTTSYSELFDKIQYTFGGSGNEFAVPNVSGKVIITYDGLHYNINQQGGKNEITLSEEHMPAHNHYADCGVHTHNYNKKTTGGGDCFLKYNGWRDRAGPPPYYDWVGTSQTYVGGATSSKGENRPFDARPPYICTGGCFIYTGVNTQ